MGAFFRLKDLRQLSRSVGLAVRTVAGVGRQVMLVLCGVSALNGLVPVAMSVAMANAIGAAPGVLRGGVDSAAGDRLTVAATVYVALLTLQGLISAAVSTAGQWIRRQVDGGVRERVMRAALRPPGTRHVEDPEMRPVLEAARAAAPGGGMSPGTVAAVLPNVLAYRIGLLARLAGLTYLSWPIGLAYLLITIKSQDEMQQAVWRVAGAGGGIPPKDVAYQLELATTAPAGKEARVFGLGDWITHRYREGMLRHISGVWSARRDFTPSLIIVLTANAALHVAALVVFGRAAIRGDLGVGELAFALSSLMALSPAFNQDDMPLAFATTTLDTVSAAERIVADPQLHLGGHREASSLPGRSIRFEGVSFRYPGTEVDVLQGVDLELRVGERVALVGLNGAGKTTLVKLLAGLYEPTDGAITVDGTIPLQDLDPVSWRQQLAVLFQDFSRFELPARDNIRLGAGHWRPPDLESELAAVAAEAGILEAIAGLPAGWDSPLSPGYEHGSDLSGGQWQRVALARALFAVKAGARVLILDEPTANLDVRAEAELFATLLSLTAGRDRSVSASQLVTLMISHRFSTVRQADRIVVLSSGRIVEDGTHEELLARSGLYAELFNSQAEQYVVVQP